MDKSRFVGVVVTKNFSESKWIKGEVHQAFGRPTGVPQVIDALERAGWRRGTSLAGEGGISDGLRRLLLRLG